MYSETTIGTSSTLDTQPNDLCRFRLPEQPGAPDRGENTQIRDDGELRAFVNAHHDMIFQKARILCYGSWDGASEVVQNLYPRLVAALHNNPSGFTTPWAMIYRVAANLAIDHHRRETIRKRFRRLDDMGEIAENRTKNPIDADTVARLYQAVALLPARVQKLLTGIFIDGRKAKELAAELNLSEARVAELKHQALTTLRSALRGLNESN